MDVLVQERGAQCLLLRQGGARVALVFMGEDSARSFGGALAGTSLSGCRDAGGVAAVRGRSPRDRSGATVTPRSGPIGGFGRSRRRPGPLRSGPIGGFGRS